MGDILRQKSRFIIVIPTQLSLCFLLNQRCSLGAKSVRFAITIHNQLSPIITTIKVQTWGIFVCFIIVIPTPFSLILLYFRCKLGLTCFLFIIVIPTPSFPPLLLYLRCKLGVIFSRFIIGLPTPGFPNFYEVHSKVGEYLKQLTPFHTDISYTHFKSQFHLMFAFFNHFTSILLKFDSRNEPKI